MYEEATWTTISFVEAPLTPSVVIGNVTVE
jgi:hypothetical protein